MNANVRTGVVVAAIALALTGPSMSWRVMIGALVYAVVSLFDNFGVPKP